MKDIKNLFKQEKEIKGIKDIVFRNIKNLFGYEKEEENYYKPDELLRRKVTVIKIQYYMLRNILIKLDHI